MDSRMKFLVGTVYVHPGTSQRDTHLFLPQSVVPHATIVPNLQPDIETPITRRGDFNGDITQNKALLEIMEENVNQDCVYHAR
jgi:hypothetical protein